MAIEFLQRLLINNQTMNTETLENDAADLRDDLVRASEPLQKSARDAVDAIRGESKKALCCASESIRKNPIPSVIGGIAFGLAVGYLISSGRQPASFQKRYVDEPLEQANDVLSQVSDSLARLASNLKFW
jgi:ElaB/YqjD/DUF883 family membrane-anchored ribosome-binding protein